MDRRTVGRLFCEAVARMAAAWVAGLVVTLLARKGDISYLEYGVENLLFTLCAAVAAFMLFSVPAVLRSLGKIKFQSDYWALLGACVLLACISSYKFMSIYYSVVCFAVLLAVAAVCFGKDRLRLPELKLDKRASLWVMLAGAGLVTAFVAAVSIVRYDAYYAPNYDFGIFANMFENMRRTGLPMTTCERDGLMSHFAVHISPIFYFLLPVYVIFPFAETLLVIQAAAIVSGAVPVWLIARKKTGSFAAAAVFSAIYMLYPAFSCGAFFDFHENKLLAPLILWALWFMEEKKRLPMYLFLLLTAMVKEDAAVYTAVIGLYMFLGRRERIHGGAVFLGSVAYFAGAVALLGAVGEGAQLWRYSNIAGGGFTAIIGSVIVNPMRVLAECAGEEKIKFIVQMLFPLLGLPLVSRKPGRYILLIPFVLVNLMPDYVYQYHIGYQYTYGSGAMLIYLAVLNWCDLRELLKENARTGAALVLCAAGVLSFMSSGARGGLYFQIWREEAYLREYIDEALELVPEDASVSASTMFVAHLADREAVYDLGETVHLTDYVAADLRNVSAREMEDQRLDFEALGYEEVRCVPYAVGVYRKVN